MKQSLALLGLVGAVLAASSAARADFNTIQASGPAGIRSITRRANGHLIGLRSSGAELEVWSSSTNAAGWYRLGTVASSSTVQYGDPMVCRKPNTSTIYCAFREFVNGLYTITICRSDNDGVGWVYDSNIVVGQNKFVGAPWLVIINGNLQCYYDSEPDAQAAGSPGGQWIVMRERVGLTGSWTTKAKVTVAREPNINTPCREGMASVVDLGGGRMMCVTEGIEAVASGGARANVVRSVQSFDSGRTWGSRQIVYQSFIHSGSGKRFNAYCPQAIRVGNGPVWVTFCTDENFPGPPDPSNMNVLQRRSHIKYVQTLQTFESWSGTTNIWTQSSQNYAPGLYERASNDVIVVIDQFFGNQRVMVP